MKEIASKYGPESLALFTHGSGAAYFTILFKASGISTILLNHLMHNAVVQEMKLSLQLLGKRLIHRK